MNFEINAFTFQFLEENFLIQIKKESLARTKPQRSILQALKHSTGLNKQFKKQIQNLRNQLSYLKKQNDNLKESVRQLNEQVIRQKLEKQCENNKKLDEIKSESKQYENLKSGQNKNKMKNSQILKYKGRKQAGNINFDQNLLNSQQNSIQNNDLITQYVLQNRNLQNSNKLQQKTQMNIIDILNSQNQITPIAKVTFSKQLIQSAKFNDYVNFQDKKTNDYQTRQNSTLNIQKQQIYQNQEIEEANQQFPKNTKKANSFKKISSQELAKMLQLKKSSNQSPQNTTENYLFSQNQLSSLQQISPKITQITSQQQIVINNQTYQQSFVQTPTLQKYSFNPQQSHFLVFAKQKQNNSDSNSKNSNLIENTSSYLKSGQYTFLQLQTQKSLQEKNISKFITQSIKISQTSSKPEKVHFQIDALQELGLENISGVDYEGLLNDIYGDQNCINKCMVKQQYSEDIEDNQIVSSGFLSFADVKSKKTTSKQIQPEIMMNILEKMKKEKLKEEESCNWNERKNKYQNIKIAVHSPNRYINITESFKTIDLDKSHKQILNQQQRKGFKKDAQKLRLNDQKGMMRSKVRENAKMTNSKAMGNSKLMMFSNVRLNKPNKEFSPVSIDRQVEKLERQDYIKNQQSEHSQQDENKYKSYSIINSTRSRRVPMSSGLGNRSCVNVTMVGNSPSVKKRYRQQQQKDRREQQYEWTQK